MAVEKPFLAIPVPLDIGAGKTDRRIIDGFSHASIRKTKLKRFEISLNSSKKYEQTCIFRLAMLPS